MTFTRSQLRALKAIDNRCIRFGPAGRVSIDSYLNAAPQCTWNALTRAGVVEFKMDEFDGWFQRVSA